MKTDSYAPKNQKKSKKSYTQPSLEIIELRTEERIAANSGGNCAACQGKQTCAPGGLHGEGQ